MQCWPWILIMLRNPESANSYFRTFRHIRSCAQIPGNPLISVGIQSVAVLSLTLSKEPILASSGSRLNVNSITFTILFPSRFRDPTLFRRHVRTYERPTSIPLFLTRKVMPMIVVLIILPYIGYTNVPQGIPPPDASLAGNTSPQSHRGVPLRCGNIPPNILHAWGDSAPRKLNTKMNIVFTQA